MNFRVCHTTYTHTNSTASFITHIFFVSPSDSRFHALTPHRIPEPQMNSLADYADLDASFQEDIETARGVETAMTAKCVMSCVDVKHYMKCTSQTNGE